MQNFEETLGRSYKRRIPRSKLRVLSIVLIACTILGSFLPGEWKLLLGTEPFDPNTGIVGSMHRLFHFATFGTTALSLLLLGRNLLEEVNAVAFTAALGLGIEVTQHLIGFSLVLEWWDVRDDFFAITAAFLAVQMANFMSAESA
jgi:hypothetical protein